MSKHNNMLIRFSKRSEGSLSLLLLVCSHALIHGLVECGSANDDQKLEVVADESQKLDDDQLSDIVRHFGDDLRATMDEEMDKLISEVEESTVVNKRAKPVISEHQLDDLKAASEAAGQDIKTRIEMAGDNKGAVPQAGLGSMATSFVAAASGRLSAAGSYVGNKMRSLSASVKQRIPAKLSRFFKWPTFFKYKIRFHKNYKSLREELYRQMIFLRTHIIVGMQHIRFLLRRDKHLLGQNQFSDMTSKEYHDQMNNEQAEVNPSQLDADSSLALEDSLIAKLKALEREDKNIFGQPVARLVKNNIRKKRHARDGDDEVEQPDGKRQRRSRRDTSNGEDFDELADDELMDSEDDFDEMELGNDLIQHQLMIDNSADDDLDPKDAYKLVEEYANDVNLDNLDDIENNIDDALQANNNFKPVDLRESGCVTRPENQNNCGCCFSHVMNAAASYYNCMDEKRDKAIRYHARFVSDCGKYLTPAERYPAINGCKGGVISKAYKFISMLGVQRFADYNIARVSAKVSDVDTCAYGRPEKLEEHGWQANIVPVPMFKKSRFTWLKENQIDLHLRTVGPVWVNVRTWKSFEHYEAGIYDGFDMDEGAVLHSMLIVGHDRDAKGRDYYIILNSHGIVWGEYGFLRIYHESLKFFGALYGGLSPLEGHW